MRAELPVAVGLPLIVGRVVRVLDSVAVIVADAVVLEDRDHVFLSQSTVAVPVVEEDADAVRVSLNSPMVIVGDEVMDAHTEDVGVLEAVVELVSVSPDVAEADWEDRDVTVALEEAEAVAETVLEGDAAGVLVFDEDIEGVPVGEPCRAFEGVLVPAGLEALFAAEEVKELVEEVEGRVVSVKPKLAVTVPAATVGDCGAATGRLEKQINRSKSAWGGRAMTARGTPAALGTRRGEGRGPRGRGE